MVAPAGTPRPVVMTLNKAVNQALASPEVKATLARLGANPLGGPPDTLTDMIADDRARWTPVVKQLHLKAE